MIDIRISEVVIDGAALAPLNGLGGGAAVSFTGIVRADDDVVAIELEYYPAMTEASIRDLAQQAMARWSLLGCVVHHRVGRIDVGETVVLIGTAASHRAEALEACSFLIDRLKTDVPFWKKEHRADGSSHWVAAKASDDAASDRWKS